MSTWDGHAPALDGNGFLASVQWKKRYVTKVAAYTCLSTESGTFFNMTGATAAVTFTLPAISEGPWHFEFFASSAVAMTVTAGTADTMMTFNDLTADSVAFSTASEIIGGRVLADCDGTSLFVNAIGVSHRQTATVAT
jgi:hypothetical protein